MLSSSPPTISPSLLLIPHYITQACHIHTSWTYIHHVYVFNTSDEWSGSSSGHVLLLTPTRLAISQAPPYGFTPNLVSPGSVCWILHTGIHFRENSRALTTLWLKNAFSQTWGDFRQRTKTAIDLNSSTQQSMRCPTHAKNALWEGIGGLCKRWLFREIVDRVWHASMISGTTRPNKGPFLLHEGNDWKNTMTESVQSVQYFCTGCWKRVINYLSSTHPTVGSGGVWVMAGLSWF